MKKTDLHILILEDDAMDVELNKTQLELLDEFNCIVQWVTDKESFINALQNQHFDIILSDFNLPAYNGLDALSDLKKMNKFIPFIFVTGAINEETAADTIKAGAWDYVVKDRLIRLPIAIKSALQLKEERTNKAKALALNLKLSKALEYSPVQIIFHDIDGIIEYVNKRFTEVSGYESNEITGKNIFEIFPEMNKELEIQEIWENLKKGISWRGEILSSKKDKSEFWESVIASPLINEANEITHFVLLKEDISARKLMEQALVEARDRAQTSDKLKDAFLQNLSHEIRTPLNSIVGFAELLKLPENRETPETIDEYLSIILDNSYQLLSIVSDILTVARIQTGQEDVIYKPVELCSMINQLYTVYNLKARERGLELKLKKTLVNDELVTVTDETKLMQILTNLLNNALKFTQQGFIEIGFGLQNSQLLFYIKDTGIGIERSSQELIFERFRRAETTIDYNYSGTGLGLSISKSFSQMLGGELWVESEPGKGSTFFLKIPYYPEKLKDKSSKRSDLLNIKKDISILIAEDEYYNYLLLKTVLTSSNITLFHAHNGYEAVELFKNNPNIDLVLMDIKMPVLDGLAAFDEIRKICASVPVIAQTAYALEQEKVKFLARGFNDYITKPIRKDELFEKINQIFANQ